MSKLLPQEVIDLSLIWLLVLLAPSYAFVCLQARDCGRALQSLSSEDRSEIIRKYAGFLTARSSLVLDANKTDLEAAKHSRKSFDQQPTVSISRAFEVFDF
jgi:hypothetical protein